MCIQLINRLSDSLPNQTIPEILQHLKNPITSYCWYIADTHAKMSVLLGFVLAWICSCFGIFVFWRWVTSILNEIAPPTSWPEAAIFFLNGRKNLLKTPRGEQRYQLIISGTWDTSVPTKRWSHDGASYLGRCVLGILSISIKLHVGDIIIVQNTQKHIFAPRNTIRYCVKPGDRCNSPSYPNGIQWACRAIVDASIGCLQIYVSCYT